VLHLRTGERWNHADDSGTGSGMVKARSPGSATRAATHTPTVAMGIRAASQRMTPAPRAPPPNCPAMIQAAAFDCPGFQDPVWPCVGEMRVVPDYLSLFPHAQEVAPFAGATRPLCDRKEVTLGNQMNVRMHFAIYTSTHIASKFTGGITDDYTSEFDPFAPQFGEKFAPPDLPVSTRDYLGNEISRVYSDHWGTYDGLTFSSWEVNPPNITGYSPSMMVQCMNDPGPIVDTNSSSPTFGQLITDPLYNPAYSDFCYEQPYMPGLTLYADTPVVPTQAFVGAGYNNVDCSYPDTTPAIKEVDGDGIGPWISAFGHTITITALGDTQVPNSAYAGPSANTAPFNLKTVNRHYGFGGTAGTVTVGGVPLTGVSWSDTSITGTVNLQAVANGPTVPQCAVQQQQQYATLGTNYGTAYCGELIITAANGRQSIDTVTVTIGGKAPTHISASSSVQAAIDNAAPGDLLIVDPTCTTGVGPATANAPCTTAGVSKNGASHQEMLIMWKPVRLQGVGAATSIINANAQPAGKLLDPWRRHINCLFGLSLQGAPLGTPIPGSATPVTYDPASQFNCPDNGPGDTWNYFTDQTAPPQWPQIDRLPLEAITGWDATVNGNLAEQLQEPSLMGAYEGAGITVLAKGVWVPPGTNAFTDGSEPGGFPETALLLQDVPQFPSDDEGVPLGPQYSYCWTTASAFFVAKVELVPNPYPSNFVCNPSSIDGLSITNSSQGGGVFVHGWAHNLQIANNRIFNNAGTLSGGVTVGQGEFPVAIKMVATGTTPPVGQFPLDAPPSCQNGTLVGQQEPYCLDLNVNVHNNDIYANSSLGDELFSGTLSGGAGATFCTGSDYYKFQYNWVCGNQSSSEGGGVAHMGYIYHGDIEHNSIVLNQSTNPTIPTNGGGIMVMGTPDTDPVCGNQIDQDCPPGLSDGTGPGLIINANLIQGNMAESGSGGGIRLQQVNGTDVSSFPADPTQWNSATITNNIIVNNLAGWDGAGISLEDSLNVAIVNNTIARNDTLASSGVLTQSIGTPEASAPAGSCVQPGPTGPTSASCPQSSGLTSMQNTPAFLTSLTGLVLRCPFVGANNHLCQGFSNPAIVNDLIYHNRAFYIGVGNLGQGNLDQQNLVSLFNAFTATPVPNQASTGACSGTDQFWDIGVRGDTSPTNHSSGFTLNPQHTMLTTGGGGGNPRFISEYCNGSRVPPECTAADGCGGPSGFGVPPGIVDASTPNPVFSLTPSATVDEGNNWINVSFGPLDLSNPAIMGTDGNWGAGLPLGNYGLDPNSGAIDRIPVTEALPAGVTVPTTDYYGNPRPNPDGDGTIDFGAVETQANVVGTAVTLSSISPNPGFRGTSFQVTLTGTNLTGASAINISGGAGNGITVSGIANVSSTVVTATFTISSTAPLVTRNVSVTASAGTSNTVPFTITAPVPALTNISPAQGVRGTAVPVTLSGSNLNGVTIHITPAGGITVSGVTTSAGTVTATFTISAGAATGARSVTVSDAAGTSNAETFTVLGPTVTGITPVSGTRGTTVAVTITGTQLTGATAVTAGGGITANTIVVNGTGTQLTANFVITNGAAPGPRDVRVTTPIGVTPVNAGVTFQVTGGTPAFSAAGLTTTPASRTALNGTVTVSNTAAGANAGPITLTANPTLAAANNSGTGTFSITAGGTCASGTVINPGGNCTINVQYVPPAAPAGPGSTITLTLNDTGAGSATQHYNVTGN
jgi:hypothetical protein